MLNVLMREQTPEGYWPCPGDVYGYVEYGADGKGVRKYPRESSWGAFEVLDGRIWATVHFTLMLEVYYSYLPSYKLKKVSAAPPVSDTAESLVF